MSKLKLIIHREFIAKVRNKSFIIMTFLSPLIMVGMGALVYFLMKKNDEKVKEIVYVDNSGLFSKEDFKNTKTIHYQDFTALGIEETKKKVEGEYWFTGRISAYFPPNQGFNKSLVWDDTALHVTIFLPVYPQFEEKYHFTIAFYSDIEKIILLE